MTNKKIYAIECEIEIAFTRIIGPLSIMTNLEVYQKIYNELNDLLKIIIKWGATFQIRRNLLFIKKEELKNVRERFEIIKEEYLYASDIGPESELSDEIVIWFDELIKLKVQLDKIKGVDEYERK